MQKEAGEGYDLTYAFWGLSLWIYEHFHSLLIAVEVGNASHSTGSWALIYTNISFYVLT